MPFEIPSFDEIRQLLVASFTGRLPTKNVDKTSGTYKRLSVVALGIADVHYHLRQVHLDVMADTATKTALKRLAKIWGLEQKGASGAAKSLGLRVFGTVGESVGIGEELRHVASGMTFETRSTGTIAASGYVDVDVAAVSTGEKTNLAAGEELQFQAPPTGISANGRVALDLENGRDNERDPDLRDRLINRIGQPNAGGNRNDFEQWVRESAPFVDSGYVYPNRNGLGTVDLAALKTGSGSARLLDAGERDQVFDHVDPLRLVTGKVRVIAVTANEVDVEICILPESDPAFSFDWDDSTVPSATSYNSTTRLVEFDVPLPVGMKAGDRVVFADTGNSGTQYVIESLSGDSAFVLTEAPPDAEGALYSGGPMTDGIRAKVQGLFDALGPANPDSSRYGNWEANLRHGNIFEAVQTYPGVLDSVPLVPAATTTEADDPGFPLNGSVELLVVRSIIVRSYASEGL